MIYSMTAFARTENQGKWGNLVCEMRSINHRYLELSLYLPESLRVLEMPIRERIRQAIKRGKVECAIRYQSQNDAQQGTMTVNTALAKELCRASEEIACFLKHAAPISPTDILRFQNVLVAKETDLSVLEQQVFELVDKNVADLIAARGREGEELKNTFLQRLDGMQEALAIVRERLPQVLKEQRERLLKRFNDVKLELDPARLEQEMVIFAQRMDVAEEIDRTETHITEIRRILKHGGSIGRRLDFLLQELNREANTLGSKSVDSNITRAVVDMKVLIEQIREQVQNIE